MPIRDIVHIDEDKCDGCGLCVPNCAEGAIQIIDGKARLVGEVFCDGLGACLGTCPRDAITIEKREADAFDEEKTLEHMKSLRGQGAPKPASAPALAPAPAPAAAAPRPAGGFGCPGAMARNLAPRPTAGAQAPAQNACCPTTELPATESQLGHWPVQLRLVPATAHFLQDADLLVVADCVPVACPDFHRRFLPGKTVVVACPKLDDMEANALKLRAIAAESGVRSISVLRMEVPCCSGLSRLTHLAVAESGRDIPVSDVIIGLDGKVMQQ